MMLFMNSFLTGLALGSALCVVGLLLLFRRLDEAVHRIVYRKAQKHADFEAVAKQAAEVPPGKVEILCHIACLDDGILGDALRCRAVFFGKTILLYHVEALRELEDHRQEVVAERFLGKINSHRVEARGERISKYHRHTNINSRYASLRGKCTVLRSKDNSPVFLVDPVAVHARKMQAVREAQRPPAPTPLEDGRGGVGGSFFTSAGDRRRARMSSRENNPERRHRRRSGGGGGGGGGHHHRRGRNNNNNNNMANPAGADFDEIPIYEWRSVAIKFPTRRENERWYNILARTEQTRDWRSYITHLPHMDVFNLLCARLFYENTRTSTLRDLLTDKVQKKMEKVKLPKNLGGRISLDDLTIGGEIPLISGVSDPMMVLTSELEFDFDVLYRGGLALSIRLSELDYRGINIPGIIFHIKVLELAGRMRFAVMPPPTERFFLGVPRPPQLRLQFTQEVASHGGFLHAVMQLLPDLSQFVTNLVSDVLFEDMILPNMDEFPWPVLSPPEDTHVPDFLPAPTKTKNNKNNNNKDGTRNSSQPPTTTAAGGDDGGVLLRVDSSSHHRSFDQSFLEDSEHRRQRLLREEDGGGAPLPAPRLTTTTTTTQGGGDGDGGMPLLYAEHGSVPRPSASSSTVKTSAGATPKHHSQHQHQRRPHSLPKLGRSPRVTPASMSIDANFLRLCRGSSSAPDGGDDDDGDDDVSSGYDMVSLSTQHRSA